MSTTLDRLRVGELKFGLGFLYPGSAYKNTHDTGADKIYMHYMAPQVALTMVQKHYQLQFSGGIGYQLYRDKSTVYDKPRKVTMSKFAGNLSLSGGIFCQVIGELLRGELAGISSSLIR